MATTGIKSHIWTVITIIVLFALYYFILRPVRIATKVGKLLGRKEGFDGQGGGLLLADGADKMLLEEEDLPVVTRTCREALMEEGGSGGSEFLTEQLGLLKEVREIYGDLVQKIATNMAAGAESRDVAAFRQTAIEQVAKETGGVAPKFCDDARVNRLLEGDATEEGLERLAVCMPAKPTKYLILLSFAAKMYMQELRRAGSGLGSGSGVATASEPGAVEFPSFPDGAAEGFADADADAAVASDPTTTIDGRPLAYTSSYRIETPPSSSSASIKPDFAATPVDNRIATWKAAYNAESMKRINAYLRYIRWARKKTGALATDLQSGSITAGVLQGRTPLA